MLLMWTMKAAQVMGNIPEAILKCFLQKDGFWCMVLRIPLLPLYPSIWIPKWLHPLLLYLQIRNFLSVLLCCTNNWTEKPFTVVECLKSRESFGDALWMCVIWVIFPLGCFQAFPDALPFVRPVMFLLPPFLELSLQLCNTEGSFDTVTDGFQPAKPRNIHLLL